MSQPARLPIQCVKMPERRPDRTVAMPVAVLRFGDQASFCVIRKLTRHYVDVGVYSNVLEGERVSVHAGESWGVSGAVVSCKRGVARIEFESPRDARTLVGLSALNDSDRRRSLPRVEAAARVRLRLNRRTVAARLHNISSTGAGISADRPFLPGDPLILTLPDYGDLRGLVCWSNTREAGLRFETPIPVGALSAWLSGRIRVSYRH